MQMFLLSLAKRPGGVMLSSKLACAPVDMNARNGVMCQAYLRLPLDDPSSATHSRVPRVLHATGATPDPPFTLSAMARSNPEFVFRYRNDSDAEAYVGTRCGADVLAAMKCLKYGSFRADVFRFCALYAEGGVYLDADLVPLVPVRSLIMDDANVTLGYDVPQRVRGSRAYLPGLQMKVAAAVPGQPIFACMLRRIVRDARVRRPMTISTLYVTGPTLLAECAHTTHQKIAFTYRDTRNTRWPYTGLTGRRGRVLVYEKASETPRASYYGFARTAYHNRCELELVGNESHSRLPLLLGRWFLTSPPATSRAVAERGPLKKKTS